MLKFLGLPAAIVALLLLVGGILDGRYQLRSEASAKEKVDDQRWTLVCQALLKGDPRCFPNLSGQ